MAVLCFRCGMFSAAMTGVACAKCATAHLAAQTPVVPVLADADTWEEQRVRQYDWIIRHRPLDSGTMSTDG